MKDIKIEAIRKCVKGAFEAAVEDGGIRFSRFPEPVRAYYHSQGAGSAIRAECAAGVVLDFRTDAHELAVECELSEGARAFGFADLYVDGRFVCVLGAAETEGRIEAAAAWPEDGQGRIRRVRLYLPHCRTVLLRSLSLPEASVFEPSVEEPLLLCLGDSITQGMNCLHPSLSYPAVAARMLGMSVHNGGVGGAAFDVRTLMEPPADSPELVTVAFGCNDFRGGSDASPAVAYLGRLRDLYPDVPITVLEPLWHPADGMDRNPGTNAAGITLQEFRERLRGMASQFKGLHWLCRKRLLPELPGFIPDGIHPDTSGHFVLGANLAQTLKVLKSQVD